VRHVSKLDGDDILSFDENGKEIYVEVKATTRGIRNHFYMSAYEKEFAIKNKDKYKLYRVYNLDLETKLGDYYIIEGDIEEELNFKVDNYRVFK